MSKIGKNSLKRAVDLSNKFGFNITIDEIINCYSENHRYWHTLTHLYNILDGIDDLYKDKKIDDREYNILTISAVFHDIIYDPKKNDNEEKSVEYMMNKFNADESTWRQEEDIKKIVNIIINTKYHDSKDSLCKKFNKLDTSIIDAQFIDMLDWENKIYKEFKWIGWKTYKKKRVEFLLKSIKDHTHNVINIKNLIDYIKNKTPKVGICYYELDKLPNITEYKKDIDENSNLFDNIVIIIVYNTDNYSKELIKEYSINSNNNEFHVLKDFDVIGYLNHRNDNVTIIKKLEYMEQYNKDIESQLNSFRTIYI